MVDLRKSKTYKYTISGILILIYTFLLINFLNIYFLRNPIYNSEGFSFSGRVLSKYIDLARNKGQKIVVITDSPGIVSPIFKQYLFYTNSYNRNTAKEISMLIRKGADEYGNLKIISCPRQTLPPNTVIIAQSNLECKTLDKNSKRISIAQLSDGGEIYSIFNDQICSKYKLNRYPYGISLGDFEVEKLPEDKFCQKFITNLN